MKNKLLIFCLACSIACSGWFGYKAFKKESERSYWDWWYWPSDTGFRARTMYVEDFVDLYFGDVGDREVRDWFVRQFSFWVREGIDLKSEIRQKLFEEYAYAVALFFRDEECVNYFTRLFPVYEFVEDSSPKGSFYRSPKEDDYLKSVIALGEKQLLGFEKEFEERKPVLESTSEGWNRKYLRYRISKLGFDPFSYERHVIKKNNSSWEFNHEVDEDEIKQSLSFQYVASGRSSKKKNGDYDLIYLLRNNNKLLICPMNRRGSMRDKLFMTDYEKLTIRPGGRWDAQYEEPQSEACEMSEEATLINGSKERK